MDVVYGDLASGGNLSAYIEEAIKDKLRKARRISDVSDP
jgi:hypothetical protein